MGRSEIERKFDDIVEFADIGEFLDAPVKTYSSGMYVRLGFAVAIHSGPDILLVDEVLAVGDMGFQNKCLARIQELRGGGTAIILVSHNMDKVQYIAQKAMVMDKGGIVQRGPAKEAVNVYENLSFRSGLANGPQKRGSRQSSGEVELVGARIYGTDGGTKTEVAAGEPFGFEVEINLIRPLAQPLFSLGIMNAGGVLCVWNVSDEDGLSSAGVEGRRLVRVWFNENRLINGIYDVHFAVREGNSLETLERLGGIASFAVVGQGRARGILVAPCRWELLPVDK